MSDLVVRQSDLTAPGKPAARSSGLPNLDRYLEPERLLKETSSAIARTSFPCMRADDASEPRDWRLQLLEYNQQQTVQALERSAPLATIDRVIRTLSAALEARPDRKVTMTALAVFLDSRARQPANPAIYIEAATYDLGDEGFPPAIVVAACQRLRREQVFLPEIAEIVGACRAERDRLRGHLSQAERAFRGRREAESYLTRLAGRLEEVRALPQTEPMWSKR